MITKTTTALCASILIAGAALADDEAAIATIFERADVMFDTCDATIRDEIDGAEATFFNNDGGPLRGVAEDRASMEGMCAAGVTLNGDFEIVSTTVSGDLGVTLAYWKGVVTLPDGQSVPSQTRVTHVAERSQTGWVTAHIHISDLGQATGEID